MKKLQHLQTFESYIASNYKNDDEVNEANLKTLALAGLMGASALSASGAGNKGKDNGDNIRIEKTPYKTTADKWIKLGKTLDSIVVINEILPSMPTKNIVVIKNEINLSELFPSGEFTLSKIAKDTIKNAFKNAYNENEVVLSVEVYSSTDKQPISQRMSSTTQIKNNKDLSTARNNAVTEYLKESGLVNDIDSVFIDIKYDQGNDTIDQSARYVKVVFNTIKPSETLPAQSQQNKEKTMYYFSSDKEVGVKKTNHDKIFINKYYSRQSQVKTKAVVTNALNALPCQIK